MQAPSKELLEQVKSGDKKAFGELYMQLRQPCYCFALMILKNREDAEDAVQNTFIRIHGSIRTLQHDEAFVMWTERILNRECIKIANRRGVEIADDNAVYSDRAPDQEDEFMLPELYAERDDLSQRLKSEIEKLPFEQRRAMLLFYYHSLSLQQIAELTDSNINTVKSRLRYARMTLKKNIEQQEKQSGDKFYGVPLLPFREIITRILDREKGEKKPAALWKGLQKDIDAVYGGFGGGLPDGGSHPARLAAGVLAAMLVLGAAAGVLSGALSQESARGWGNLQGGEQPENSNQILSPDPESQNDFPMRSPNQANTPFAPDEYAQNILNAPQNAANYNNPQTPAVLPTQSSPNMPLSPMPTSARLDTPLQQPQTPQTPQTPQAPQSTPLPTQAEEEAQEQDGNPFGAYRDLLQQNAQAIQNYNWQYSDGSAPVTLADITGDGTPELLFVSADGNTARLNIYTYDGEKTVSLLSDSDGFRSVSDINDAYFLYQKAGDKRLYLYTASNGDYGTFRNLRFDESSGGLSAVELATGRSYPSRYTVGDSTVSHAVYADYEKSLFSDISGILLRNDFRGMCSQEAYEALGRYSPSALSLNDMLTYLEDNQ